MHGDNPGVCIARRETAQDRRGAWYARAEA
jgi:hypothetical protein